MYIFRFFVVMVFVASTAVLPLSAGESTPDNPRYIALSNKGTYTISDIWVKWKVDGDTKSRKFTADVTQDDGFCVDLSKVQSDGDYIPEGSEVWIEAQIALGEKKSCRKDRKHYYKKTNKIWYLKMGGETLTKNRCENTDHADYYSPVASGNSSYCG